VVGVVHADGRPGTLTYPWVRSDGTTSGVLRERVAPGREQAGLHVWWRFDGEGTLSATAELRITSPGRPAG
jgi:hypothetical protein